MHLSSVCIYLSLLISSSSFVLNDFQMYKIDISLLLEHAECSFPASLVISSVTTGSRTILHMNRFVCTVSTMKLFPHRMAVAADHIKTTTENILTAQNDNAFPLKGALNGAWFKVQCGTLCEPAQITQWCIWVTAILLCLLH